VNPQSPTTDFVTCALRRKPHWHETNAGEPEKIPCVDPVDASNHSPIDFDARKHTIDEVVAWATERQVSGMSMDEIATRSGIGADRLERWMRQATAHA